MHKIHENLLHRMKKMYENIPECTRNITIWIGFREYKRDKQSIKYSCIKLDISDQTNVGAR